MAIAQPPESGVESVFTDRTRRGDEGRGIPVCRCRRSSAPPKDRRCLRAKRHSMLLPHFRPPGKVPDLSRRFQVTAHFQLAEMSSTSNAFISAMDQSYSFASRSRGHRALAIVTSAAPSRYRLAICPSATTLKVLLALTAAATAARFFSAPGSLPSTSRARASSRFWRALASPTSGYASRVNSFSLPEAWYFRRHSFPSGLCHIEEQAAAIGQHIWMNAGGCLNAE